MPLYQPTAVNVLQAAAQEARDAAARLQTLAEYYLAEGHHHPQAHPALCVAETELQRARTSVEWLLRDIRADRLAEQAEAIGREHGASAASWYEVADAAVAQRVLDGLADCDPEVLDTLPQPDLSGQWADGYTPDRLAEDLVLLAREREHLLDGLCDAYECGFRQAAEEVVQRACQAQL